MKNLLFSFQGRVNRAKFWLVAVAMIVVEMVVFGLTGGAALMSGDPQAAMSSAGGVVGIVWLILFIVVFWISLAMAVKRYHDRNKSGWWILIVLVPAIGSLWYLIECGFLKGTTGPNDYGPDPLVAA